MDHSLDRRKLLKLSAGAAVAGLAAPVLFSGTASAEGALPPVPGMLGDRRANELWYQLDEKSLYNAAQEVRDAYTAIFAVYGRIGFYEAFYVKWLELSQQPGYPGNYAEYVEPVKEPLKVLSKLQLGVFDTYYRPGSPGLTDAFAAFGQGVLFDPRRAANESEVHTMDGDPPGGYHVWYAIQRAMMVLDIDRQRWACVGPVLGLAWALQSIAKPDHRHVNPGLPAAQVRALERSWLAKDVRRLDVDFRSQPYPS